VSFVQRFYSFRYSLNPKNGSYFYTGSKGVNNRWKDVLTTEDIEQYEQAAREKLGVDCAYWLSTGMLQYVENA
jgi:hypothetical protein